MRARHRRTNQDPSPAPAPAPSPIPNQAPSLYVTKLLPKFVTKPFYMAHAKYYSWKRRRVRRCVSVADLDDWEHIDDWVPPEVINDHTKHSGDEYYDINFPYYCHAFVFGSVAAPISPLDDILPITESRKGGRTNCETKDPTKD